MHANALTTNAVTTNTKPVQSSSSEKETIIGLASEIYDGLVLLFNYYFLALP